MEPTAPRSARVEIGSIFAGKYRVEEHLGASGRSAAYRALQIDLERPVALRLHDDLDGPSRDRFLREARITAEIHHPCVATVFDAGTTGDGVAYSATELLEGETLAERIAREGRLDAARAVEIAAGVCSALEAVHKKGFLHRDVRPSNVFLATRGDGVDPKLIDFGTAKRIEVDVPTLERITRRSLFGQRARSKAAHELAGTPQYLSPEQICGAEVDARADVYAVAATLYEALSGAPPFEAASTDELLRLVVTERPKPIAERAPDAAVPAALEKVVLRALSKDPNERYATAAVLSNALWSALAEARAARAPVETIPPPLPIAKGAPRWIAIAAIAATLIAAVLIFRARPKVAASSPPAPATLALSAAPAPPDPPEPAAAPEPTAGAQAALARPAPRAQKGRASASAAPSGSPPSYRLDDLKSPY